MATTQQSILLAVQAEQASFSNPTTIPYTLSQNIASMLVDYAASQSDVTYQQQLVSLAQQAPKCADPVLISSACAGEHQAWLVKVSTLVQNSPSVFSSFDIGSWLAVGGLGLAAWYGIKAFRRKK
ncbi:MAG TPA: hypothetical protein PL001_00100 [Candidatus Kryptobacter bacterium]|nr:hypothetical protein [Candidatus Kryptobacter bacterium]